MAEGLTQALHGGFCDAASHFDRTVLRSLQENPPRLQLSCQRSHLLCVGWTGLTGKNFGGPFIAFLNDPWTADQKGNPFGFKRREY